MGSRRREGGGRGRAEVVRPARVRCDAAPIVSSRRMELRRHCTSSCFSSSMRMAMGYRSSGMAAGRGRARGWREQRVWGGRARGSPLTVVLHLGRAARDGPQAGGAPWTDRTRRAWVRACAAASSCAGAFFGAGRREVRGGPGGPTFSPAAPRERALSPVRTQPQRVPAVSSHLQRGGRARPRSRQADRADRARVLQARSCIAVPSLAPPRAHRPPWQPQAPPGSRCRMRPAAS